MFPNVKRSLIACKLEETEDDVEKTIELLLTTTVDNSQSKPRVKKKKQEVNSANNVPLYSKVKSVNIWVISCSSVHSWFPNKIYLFSTKSELFRQLITWETVEQMSYIQYSQ
jgi:hypothetical protein